MYTPQKTDIHCRQAPGIETQEAKSDSERVKLCVYNMHIILGSRQPRPSYRLYFVCPGSFSGVRGWDRGVGKVEGGGRGGGAVECSCALVENLVQGTPVAQWFPRVDCFVHAQASSLSRKKLVVDLRSYEL